MYTASCLCQSVQFRINQEIEHVLLCHCKQCQRAQGSAFVAVAVVQYRKIEFIQGEDLIGEYSSSPGKKRTFCKICASPLYSSREDLPEVRRLRVGIINEPLKATIHSQAFTQNKAAWYTIADDTSFKFRGHVI